MDTIICNLQPFDRYQKVYIYKEDEQIDEVKAATDKCSESIFHLADQYGIKNITLGGPRQYVKGLIKQIQMLDVETYNKHILQFTIL